LPVGHTPGPALTGSAEGVSPVGRRPRATVRPVGAKAPRQ